MEQNMDTFIQEFREKNYQNFDDFYMLTNRKVYYAIISIVKDDQIAADLLQDTFMNFLNKIDQYKPGSNIYAYLSRIGRNLSINYYNKYKKEIHSDLILDSIQSDEIIDQKDKLDILKILNYLNKDQREVIVLHVINEFKFREIADIMDKPIGTILWIYSKAIKILKEKVGVSYE
ncbi:MAG: RNA polymerase sigma factor [Acholeplasmataceae bacterium]|nr:RNA polymerase sigma factor [Acholeplasmataceae bacterium]